MLSLAEYRLGRWSDAASYAEQGAVIAETTGPGLPRTMLHLAALLPLAGRGQWEAAEEHAAKGAEAATNPFETALAWMGGAALAHARGQHDKVIDAVASLRATGDPGAVDEPGGPWPWQELQVEALIGTSRLEEAEEVLGRFERLAEARSSLAATAVAARLRGCLEAARGCERQAQPRRPGEGGRRQGADTLRLGPHERGVRRLPSPGRKALGGSGRADLGPRCFDRLGARPYVARCDKELAATGLTPQRGRVGNTAELTPQEKSVAELVAQGKTNRKVASELVLSVNTIEYHLKNIYAKLGISSRSQLTLRFGVRTATANGSANS